jgi:S-adenosylmethionine:tRNA ribosyltransferase-isomerase
MQLSDFHYELPEALIAQHPNPSRTGSRLLHVQPQAAPSWSDRQFSDLPRLLRPGDLLVMNDTRVIKARLWGSKPTGGRIEALVERIDSERTALAMVRASHAPRPGMTLRFGEFEAQVLSREGAFCRLAFSAPVLDVLDACGTLPLPPYISHDAEPQDAERYQTVYARHPGAVAAPTAGLHFDEALLQTLGHLGVGTAFVTLHVGAGTFAPVRVDRIEDHVMHIERLHMPAETVEAVRRAREAGGRIVAVGTTSLRALESCADPEGRLQAGWRDTQLFIRPGYAFRVVDQLITNFHLPRSTLLMLVSAFIGFDLMKAAYAHAVAERYRFFSYGDAMLLDRSDTRPG